jgi:carboxypeptidase Taq
VIAAQLFEGLRADTPDLDERLARGEFAAVTRWLAEHVHAEGARLTPPELVKQATGKALTAASSLRYLESKYLEDPR